MQDDYQLTHSPLCRTVTDAGHTIQVEIYRGPDTGWTLEVVDEFNNSRVWDDQFPTDREALDELLRTVREDGIQSLVG